MMCLVGVVISGVVRVGPLRLSAYGLCAAVGLVGALWLSLRTARMVRVEPAEIWDAGLVGLTAAFVVSRLLLVVRNWQAFVQFPMAVVALPSFTYVGMGITAVLVWGYLVRRKLPVLRVMDAWTPCAALVAAALEVGHWMEGSDAGMPWRGRLVPVQEIGAAAALGLCGCMLISLRRRSGLRGQAGFGSGLGLVIGGMLAFGLDMLSQPVVDAKAWLEPGQWVAVGAMTMGTVVLLERWRGGAGMAEEQRQRRSSTDGVVGL